MKNSFLLLVAVLLVGFLCAYMFLYQVNYDEVAVLATFEKATPDSIKREPGLYPCWPRPIQRVYTYSTRVQVFDSELEQMLTADQNTFIIRSMVAWKIVDPLLFFTSLQNTEEARKRLDGPIKSQVRTALAQYRLDQFVNTDPAKQIVSVGFGDDGSSNAVPEHVTAWEAVQRTVLAGLKGQLSQYGIKVVQVGLRRMVLPGDITTNVAAAMRSNRERLAAGARAQGESIAREIESSADRAKDNILAFANRRAQDIRAQGLKEAAKYYEVFNQAPELAIALRMIDAAKKIFAHNTTFILELKALGAEELNGGVSPTTRPAPVDATNQ
jgi:modulator of FtsH protease HflC